MKVRNYYILFFTIFLHFAKWHCGSLNYAIGWNQEITVYWRTFPILQHPYLLSSLAFKLQGKERFILLVLICNHMALSVSAIRICSKCDSVQEPWTLFFVGCS
jgi:hypothetical protein